MTEQEILKAFQPTIVAGMNVKHKATPEKVGTVLGKSTHPMYELDVLFDDGLSPCYRRNLIPEWWPTPV